MDDDLRYDAFVSAGSEAEAFAIAVEALPWGARVLRTLSNDVSAVEGKDSWCVTIWFEGRFGRP